MNAEEKRKFVDLTVRDPMRKHPAEADGPVKEINEKIRQRMRKQQIEIRLKHFNPEQLVALLDFYETDMGKSIITSQGRISDEIASAMQLVTHEVMEEIQGKKEKKPLRRCVKNGILKRSSIELIIRKLVGCWQRAPRFRVLVKILELFLTAAFATKNLQIVGK